MAPTPDLRIAAERVKASLEGSPAWTPALAGATVRSSPVLVTPLLAHDTAYYLAEIVRGTAVTARMVLNADGVLLEAEGVKAADASLKPLVDSAPGVGAGRLVWRSCDQSTSRLRPFWEYSSDGSVHYQRVDGATFTKLTITGSG